MNDRQRKFCEHYAGSGNATAAAQNAGYSPRTAYAQGARLLRNPEIVNYIRDLQERAQAERLADVDESRAFLTCVMRNDNERIGARIRAAQTLMRAGGAFLPAREDEATAEAQQNDLPDSSQIVLPWNGQGLFNAYENESGEIVPIQTPDDLLIYVSQEQLKLIEKAVTMDALSDEDEEIIIKDRN